MARKGIHGAPDGLPADPKGPPAGPKGLPVVPKSLLGARKGLPAKVSSVPLQTPKDGGGRGGEWVGHQPPQPHDFQQILSI